MSADAQYTRYKNVYTFATEWRHYNISTALMDEKTFRTNMQTDEYIYIEGIDPRHKKGARIYLFSAESRYNKSVELKRLLNNIKNPYLVILISYEPLSTYCRRVINSYAHLDIKTYLHKIFDLVVPRGPLCYPHRILSQDEVQRLCNEDLFCKIIDLPKIYNDDPQCVWIGAESTDVVEIKMCSDIAGETVVYRLVIPRDGRIVNKPLITEDDDDEKIQTPLDVQEAEEEEDDELREYRERNVAENDAASDQDEPEELEELVD